MLGKYFDNVRKKPPLIHCITNYVTVNDVANVLLACGASPVMADEPEDAAEISSLANGLNINIGTLNTRTIDAMFAAARNAKILLLDPVGAGATTLRTQTALKLMREFSFDVIRGNSSEIKTLALGSGKTHGVDADKADAVNEKNLPFMVDFLKDFAKTSGAIIALTGAVDLVANSEKCFVISNGRPEMGKITGTGCQLSAMVTAFIAANPDEKLQACASAVCAMGLAGEIAFSNLLSGEGNSTYRNKIIDAIYNMDGKILDGGAKYDVR